MTDSKPIIVWFRKDLRLQDNPALWFAAQSGKPIIPLYILDTENQGKWETGAASLWWLHHSLASLQKSFGRHNTNLILRKGNPLKILEEIIKDTGADMIVWNRQYEPWAVKRDKSIKSSLDLEVKSFKASLLFEPWEIKTKSKGEFYKVYTPFMKACREREEMIRPPYDAPSLKTYSNKIDSDDLKNWDLLPEINWDDAFYKTWDVGEEAAHVALKDFIDDHLTDYKDGRNYPAEEKEAVSRMSPHLHWGEISPNQIWHMVKKERLSEGRKTYLNEIIWREFCYNLLYNVPNFTDQPMHEKFQSFKWSASKNNLKAWQKGKTGYPIVDAGMRQLWQTGWMHNRVRMIVGSFLVKDLHIDWRKGEKWFWDCLVDADLANNSGGWQWVAGCGADAQPFFRIFNPITQSEKFDKKGDYIRAYVPELKNMPDKYIHAPWDAPEDVLDKAGIVLGKDYPEPVVNHKQAREEALARYAEIK